MMPAFNTYSIAQLQEALRVVDGRKFPENKTAIEAEIQSRIESGEYAQQEEELAEEKRQIATRKISFAKKMRPLIAKYLIGTGAFVLGSQIVSPQLPAGLANTAIFAAGVLYFGMTIVAGVALLKSRDWATRFCIVILTFQLISLASPALGFQALSAIGFHATIGAGMAIGFSVEFSPGFNFYLDTGEAFTLGFNIFAAMLIRFLIIADRQEDLS